MPECKDENHDWIFTGNDDDDHYYKCGRCNSEIDVPKWLAAEFEHDYKPRLAWEKVKGL